MANSTTTTTTTTTVPAAAKAPGKDKDSLKSTWRTWDRSQWNIHHWVIELLNAHPFPLDYENSIPKHDKKDKVPHLAQYSQVIWVLFYAAIPMAIHQGLLAVPGIESLGTFWVFNLYFIAFNLIVIREIQVLRKLGMIHGFLDGDVHARDDVPDTGVGRIAASLYKTTGSRILLTILMSYDPKVSPIQAMSDPKWWGYLLVEIGLYAVVLDFWFYWYHRAMHDVDFLWKYHRTHHLTKHPNALMSAYADHEQEVFDMVGIPLLTWLTLHYAIGLPMGFYEWWLCHQFIVYTEVWGHSGLRVHLAPPSTATWFLQQINAEIVVEDHDLHHRRGYRKTANYGKQTRLWDKVFGTQAQRIESKDGNVDYVNQGYMPIF